MHMTFDHWKDPVGRSVSQVTEGIRTFSFCSALKELYFAVWVRHTHLTHPGCLPW